MGGKTDRSGKNSEPNHIYKTTQRIPSTSNFHSFPTEFRTRQPHFCLGLSYLIIEFIRFSCHKGNIKMLLLASIWILLLFLVRNWISERQCHSFYVLRTMRICHHQRISAHPTTGFNSVTATSVNSWKAFFDRNKIGARRKSEFVGGNNKNEPCAWGTRRNSLIWNSCRCVFWIENFDAEITQGLAHTHTHTNQ